MVEEKEEVIINPEEERKARVISGQHAQQVLAKATAAHESAEQSKDIPGVIIDGVTLAPPSSFGVRAAREREQDSSRMASMASFDDLLDDVIEMDVADALACESMVGTLQNGQEGVGDEMEISTGVLESIGLQTVGEEEGEGETIVSPYFNASQASGSSNVPKKSAIEEMCEELGKGEEGFTIELDMAADENVKKVTKKRKGTPTARRATKEEKEVQSSLHRLHLLCHMAHAQHVISSILGSDDYQAVVLSLLSLQELQGYLCVSGKAKKGKRKRKGGSVMASALFGHLRVTDSLVKWIRKTFTIDSSRKTPVTAPAAVEGILSGRLSTDEASWLLYTLLQLTHKHQAAKDGKDGRGTPQKKQKKLQSETEPQVKEEAGVTSDTCHGGGVWVGARLVSVLRPASPHVAGSTEERNSLKRETGIMVHTMDREAENVIDLDGDVAMPTAKATKGKPTKKVAKKAAKKPTKKPTKKRATRKRKATAGLVAENADEEAEEEGKSHEDEDEDFMDVSEIAAISRSSRRKKGGRKKKAKAGEEEVETEEKEKAGKTEEQEGVQIVLSSNDQPDAVRSSYFAPQEAMLVSTWVEVLAEDGRGWVTVDVSNGIVGRSLHLEEVQHNSKPDLVTRALMHVRMERKKKRRKKNEEEEAAGPMVNLDVSTFETGSKRFGSYYFVLATCQVKEGKFWHQDVTHRYTHDWVHALRNREKDSWWAETLALWQPDGIDEAIVKAEAKALAAVEGAVEMPTTVAAIKSHPLFVLEESVNKYQAIHPLEQIGEVKGKPVHPRRHLHDLHAIDKWVQLGMEVLEEMVDKPFKHVDARPRPKITRRKQHLRFHGGQVTEEIEKVPIDMPQEDKKGEQKRQVALYGPWQVRRYQPKAPKDGKVPVNEYGNVYLFHKYMLPLDCVHLKLPGIERVAKKLGIHAPLAMVGWKHVSGWMSVPELSGAVVLKDVKETLLSAYYKTTLDNAYSKAHKKRQMLIVKWRRLARLLLTYEQLQKEAKEAAGGGSQASAAGESGVGATVL